MSKEGFHKQGRCVSYSLILIIIIIVVLVIIIIVVVVVVVVIASLSFIMAYTRPGQE